MSRSLSLAWLVFCSILGCAPEPAASDRVPSERTATVDAPEKLTLYSIDGRHFEPGNAPQTKEKFHDYPVLGKIELVDSAQRRAIMAALKGDMARGDKPKACFLPRHGIRTLEGGTNVDYVICYECSQVEVHGGRQDRRTSIAQDSQAVLNKHLKAAGIPLAPSPLDRPPK